MGFGTWQICYDHRYLSSILLEEDLHALLSCSTLAKRDSFRLHAVGPRDGGDFNHCATSSGGGNLHYTFRSTATRATDGRIIDTNVKTIGSGHACFGQSANPAASNFYMELLLGNAAFNGIGECLQVKSDYPERGMTVVRCFLDLSDPLGRYVGGQLTTNTMWSLKLLGVDSDPPGYAQPSIATMRVWKKRAER